MRKIINDGVDTILDSINLFNYNVLFYVTNGYKKYLVILLKNGMVLLSITF